MIRNRKKWLASVLALAITLNNCGGFTVLAMEDAVPTESAVSENNMFEEATSLPDIEAASETDEAETETKLSTLHIGQIPEGENLPASDDDTFPYDLPVSFETTENLILFTNYTLEEMSEDAENGSTLKWSILRGEKGLPAGSVSLLDAEDDWDGFDEVSSSPCFTLEAIEDKDSAYDRMMSLAPGGTVLDETYDYYIRAAYYPETEKGTTEDFYAAATIPFMPFYTNDAEQEQETENQEAVEMISENHMPDYETVSSNELPVETSLSENHTDTVDSDISEESPADTLSATESSDEDTLEKAVFENVMINQTEEADYSLSENNVLTTSATPSANSDTALLTDAWDGKISLYQGTAIVDDKESIPLTPGDTLQISAKTAPETAPSDILWESSDEEVAAVTADTNGTATVTASAKGYARITASSRGITASVVIDVVSQKDNPDYDKLLDLSGDIRVAGFEKESLVYNGQKITQHLRVYHKDKLLTEKTDYTLSYKNNVNAATYNAAKAPSVTIKLKGQYQGSVTLYYTIKPLDINNIDRYSPDTTIPDENDRPVRKSPGYEQAVNYKKKLSIPAPALTFGKKKLTANKDFVCDYATPGESMTALPTNYKNGDLYAPGRVYSYTVNGTGNFTGSFPMQLVVLKDKKLNFSSASVKLDKNQYEYHGAPLTKSDVRVTEVKINGTVLRAADFDYEVSASGTEGAYVTVSPSTSGYDAGYRGCRKITLKVVGDRQIKNAVPGANWKESIPFSQKTVDKNGGIFQSQSSLLAFSDAGTKTALTEGIDYTVKYSNAKKAGKATATFTGKGRYKGSLKLTYTIAPNTNISVYAGKNVKKANGTFEVAYQKGGAEPELILKDQEYTILKNKTDYTIKYKNNQTPGTPMTCEIKGKGSYAGYEEIVTLHVTKADIGRCTLSLPDKPYSDKPNKWKSTVTIKDTNGKKLTAGKDYDKAFSYSHTQELSPKPNTEITVTVKGLGCYEGSSITGTYRIFAKNISSLKVVIDPQEYTGEAITLTPVVNIHLYASASDAKNKQNEIKTTCYEIIEYKNSVKAGTAKVTLRGVGDYGGTKTYSFKIQKKKYQINHVKGIKLDKTSLTFSLADKKELRKLTATITPETPDQILANPTVIWTSSNSNIAIVEPVPATGETGSQNPLVSSVAILAKTSGTVTITATAQDGNKKAKCTVKVSIPKLKQANQTIEGKTGDTYQLTFAGYENQAPDADGITFESDNPGIVSVTEKGLLTMNKIGASTIRVYIGGKENVQRCYVVVGGTVTDPESDSKALVYHQKEGCTDDTPYINKMLRDWEWGNRSQYDYMYLPAGVYHIDPTAGGKDALGNNKFGGIVLTENQTLIMSPEAKLMAIKNNQSNYQIINVFGRSNVTISGGQIVGDRDSHSGSGGEWGHGIAIFGCTNVYIHNVEISKCWGDGIYLGFYDGPNTSSKGVTISGCNLHDNRRNNLSITDVSNVTVQNCTFTNARGKDPQYGIDIEPNNGRTCSNVTISNSSFKGNAGGTIQILGQLNAHVKNVTIENCSGDKAPVKWQGFGGSVSGVTEKGNKWN